MARLWFLSIAIVVASITGVHGSTFHDKLRSTPQDDAKALFELGEWCQEKKRDAWAAVCFKRVIALGDTAWYPQAAYELARIDLRRGRHEDAYRLLRQLLGTHSHSGAHELLEEAESNTTKAQRELLVKGSGLEQSREFRKALKVYEKAYKLIPANTGGADFVPRAEVLQRIASCRDRLDEEQFRKKIKPVKHQIESCVNCRGQGGFVKCSNCKGRGQVKVKRRKGRRVIWVWVTCGTCSGYKWLVCKQCGGFCYTTKAFNKKEREAVIKTVKKSKDLKTLKMPLKKAIVEMENLILGLDESAALNFMRAVPSSYSHSRLIRRELGSVPPVQGVREYASQRWKTAKGDPRVRASFLSSYATEYARFVRQYDMLRPKGMFSKFGELPSSEDPVAQTLKPELLAAFPEIGKKNWVTVRGIFRSYIDPSGRLIVKDDDKKLDDDASIADFADASKGILDIEGDVPHSVHFFVWRPEAKAYLERLAGGKWKGRIGKLTKYYPFDIVDRVAFLEKNHEVTLVGRLLRDPFSYPRNWFEVWDVRVGLSESQAEIFPLLAEPIEMSVDSVPATEVLKLVEWFGVTTQLERMKGDQLVRVEAKDCAVGVLIDELVKALGASWTVEGGAIRIKLQPGHRGGPPELIARLDAANVGTCEVGTATRGGSDNRGQPTDLPDSVVGLARAFEESMARMEYARAAACCARLVTRLDGTPEWAGRVRDRCRASLFEDLTRATPRSQLVAADELARIVVRNRSGETFESTVRVVDRQGGYLWVQPGYGGTVRIETTAIRKEEPIDASYWKQQKKTELDTMAEGVTGADSSRVRANKLFVMALHAKTHGFEERGTEFLDRALREPHFPWLIETYFPSRRDVMLRNWRGAIRDLDIKPATLEPVEEPEPVVEEPQVDEALPQGTDALLEYANRNYRAAKRLLKKALPGMDGAKEARKKAVEHLNSSLEALDVVFKEDPEHDEARRLQDDVTFLHHVCVKQLDMFD